MDLFILRHGQAEEISATIKSDSKRKLTVVGKKEIEDVAKSIKSLGIEFDYIITSPLKRAQETALIVATKLKTKKNNQMEWDELKPEGNKKEFYQKLSKLKEDSQILIVGHEPSLSSILGEIISRGGSSCSIDLKKAGFAKIRILSKNPRIHGELKWLLTPRQVKKFIK